MCECIRSRLTDSSADSGLTKRGVCRTHAGVDAVLARDVEHGSDRSGRAYTGDLDDLGRGKRRSMQVHVGETRSAAPAPTVTHGRSSWHTTGSEWAISADAWLTTARGHNRTVARARIRFVFLRASGLPSCRSSSRARIAPRLTRAWRPDVTACRIAESVQPEARPSGRVHISAPSTGTGARCRDGCLRAGWDGAVSPTVVAFPRAGSSPCTSRSDVHTPGPALALHAECLPPRRLRVHTVAGRA